MLLCWWLLHAARIISNGSLHRLARKRWVVGVLQHNIKSHHMTLIEQNITLVKSRQWETQQCNHQIFSSSYKSKKTYVWYPTSNPGNRAARCDVRLVPEVPGQVLNGIRSTLRVGPPLYLLAWLCYMIVWYGLWQKSVKDDNKILDPVGSTVRYEMMKLCTGSV